MKNTMITTTVLAVATFFGFYPFPSHTHQEVYHIAGNFTADLVGTPDTRPDTWGTYAVAEWDLTFVPPPAGYQIRIHKIVGDITAWHIRHGGPANIGNAGFLGGIYTGQNQGSQYADWAADNHFVYVQGTLGASVGTRVEFDQDYDGMDKGAIIQDGKLRFKVASYLNDTPYDIHIEITFSQIEFCYEKIR